MSVNFTPHTWTAEEATSTLMNTEIKDPWTGIQAAWTSYTPSWTAATTNPVIGNGTITGAYLRIGKTILFRFNITAGSTTTYGSGAYSVSLPVTAHGTGRQIIQVDLVIGSTYSVRGRIEASGTTAVLWTPGTTAGGADRAVTPTVPATFATGATLSGGGHYEAA